MSKTSLLGGTVHQLPDDFRKAILSNKDVTSLWQDITPLARNEWICWVENAKLNETRVRRIARADHDLGAGKRRPCCWMGCIHRTDKDVSPSVRGILSR